MFLLLYSYVILFDFNQSISLAEWILIGWIGTMIVEEIREVCLLTNIKYIIMVSGGFFLEEEVR